MTRVCVVSTGMPHEHGGAELRALRHVQYLRKQPGFDAFLVAWDHQEMTVSSAPSLEYVYPVALPFQHDKSFFLPLYLTGLFFCLGSRLFHLRKRMDVMHVVFAFSWFNLAAVALGKFLGKPVVLEMTALGTDDPLSLNRRAGHPERQLFPHEPLKYRLFKLADHYVSKSAPLTDAYCRSGLPEKRLAQIASAVDIDRFSPLSEPLQKNALRRKLGLGSDELIILYTGRLNAYKGLDWLAAAFGRLAPVNPALRLVFVGAAMRMDDAFAKALRENIDYMGLGGRVTFTGRVENVHEYLQAADIFAIPTEREGFSGAILEAMSCGLPIVASDIPEIAKSQITHGVEGLLAPVGDVDRLTESLASLIADSRLRQRLGEAARQRILREFTPEIIGAQYMNLYREVVSSGYQQEISGALN